MTTRIFNDEIRSSLTCKPGYEDVIPLVSFNNIDPVTIPLFAAEFLGRGQRATMTAIDAVCAARSEVEFAVSVGSDVYLVNTEGADYARYIGKLGHNDAKAVLSNA